MSDAVDFFSGRSMKVLMVINGLAQGGAERAAANIATALAAKNFDVTILTLHAASNLDYSTGNNVKRICLDLYAESNGPIDAILSNISRWKKLRKQFKETQADVIVSFHTANNVLSILASHGLGSRVLVSERCHPPNAQTSGYWLKLRGLTYRFADAVVVLTEQSKQWIEEHTKPKRVVVVPNMVEWPPSSFAGTKPPEDHISSEKALVAVGRLVFQKGYPLLITAFGELAEQFPDWNLYIVGGGEQSELMAEIRAAGLEERIILVGIAGNIGDWYQAADAYVLSSVSEGFPNSLAEAMAAGCPVVSFDCETGPRDLIRHEDNGLLAKAKDSEDLRRQLTKLLADEQLRATLGENAKNVLCDFSVTSISEQWQDLICDVQSSAGN